MIKYIKLGRTRRRSSRIRTGTSSPTTTSSSTSPTKPTRIEEGHIMELHDRLVRTHRGALDRLLRSRRLRPRRRHAAAGHRQGRPASSRDDQLDRHRLGRQRGVAARGRRRDLRRLPALVRDDVQRLLPRAVPGARGPHPARRRVRVPRQARLGARGASAWDWAIVVGSALPALLFGVAFGNIVSGTPIEPLAGTPATTDFAVNASALNYTGNLFNLLNPFSLLVGVMTLTIFMAHGAIFLALKTSGEVREASRKVALHDRASSLQ